MMYHGCRWAIAIPCLLLAGQGPLLAYFQQEVGYTIDVKLDDRAHTLSGHIGIAYKNNAPDTLYEIYIHLYPNAYSSRETAFARQQNVLGATDFLLAGEWEMGSIGGLDFHIDGQRVPWSLDAVHPDIAVLRLLSPLLPGGVIEITTPFEIRIPRAFSRLGRIGQSYQITQWYPKPAVYDIRGWHPQPYLDQGEFYSEFGSFQVSITLPANYLVAATGTLHTPDEIALLDSLSAAKNVPLEEWPPSDPRLKTLVFTADKVHDFAWFADKRFAVRKRRVSLDDREVTSWAFFTHAQRGLWESAVEKISDAVQFFSEHVGTYPYPQMTAVNAPLSSGRGMEYPMITVIGTEPNAISLDQVIVHEVGHNWFYGVLASDERAYPWIDEGITTYYEYQYLLDKYGVRADRMLLHTPAPDNVLSDPQLLLAYYSVRGALYTPESDPAGQPPLLYTLGAYYKPALAFWMLRSYLGEDAFTEAMRAFYNTWKFRHPAPGDIRQVFEAQCSCDLGWLFEDLLGTSQLPDYRIEGLDEQGQLVISNQGKVDAPVQIFLLRGDSILYESWIDGFSGSRNVQIPLTGVTAVHLYDHAYTLDATPSDNLLRNVQKGGVRKRKPGIRAFGGTPAPHKVYVNVLPVPGWNDYDKGMIGLSLSNITWPPQRWRWSMIPMYGTGSNSFTGLGELRYTLYPRSQMIRSVTLASAARSFHYNHDAHYGFRDRYLKTELSLEAALHDPVSDVRLKHRFGYRAVYVRQWYGQGIDADALIWERRTRDYSVHELFVKRESRHALSPYSATFKVHLGKGFVRLAADYSQKFVFRQNNKGFYFHAFAGWLPHYDNPGAEVRFGYNGITSRGFRSRDYLYDELLFARNAGSGILSQQVFMKDAQLKTLDRSGLSESWMVAAGIASDTPLPLPVQPYFDAVLLPDALSDGVVFNYSGGLALVVLKDILEVYFPLVESADIRNSLTYLDRKSVLQRASIRLNLKALNLFDLTDRLLEP